jgi:hypothetical protein
MLVVVSEKITTTYEITLLGIITTGKMWWVLGNSATFFLVFIFTSHSRYRPLSFGVPKGYGSSFLNLCLLFLEKTIGAINEVHLTLLGSHCIKFSISLGFYFFISLISAIMFYEIGFKVKLGSVVQWSNLTQENIDQTSWL